MEVEPHATSPHEAVVGFATATTTSTRLSSAKRRSIVTDSQLKLKSPHWFPELVAVCLQYLDLVSLVSCETVSREWCVAARSPATWQSLYCSLWRRGLVLPAQTKLSTFTTHEWKTICRQRRSIPLKLSTRATWWVLPDQTLRVQSFGSRRSFGAGCIEAVRTDGPLEPLSITRQSTQCGSAVCYFEARVRGCGSVGFVSVSNTNEHRLYGVGSSFHVGWFPVSYGYHGDDGRLYWNERIFGAGGHDEAYGPLWGHTRSLQRALASDQLADTIGSGINLRTGQLFFTKNGEFLGYTPVSVQTSRAYAAAVSLHHLGDTADINLGRKAFVFDIETFIMNEIGTLNAQAA